MAYLHQSISCILNLSLQHGQIMPLLASKEDSQTGITLATQGVTSDEAKHIHIRHDFCELHGGSESHRTGLLLHFTQAADILTRPADKGPRYRCTNTW